MMPVESDDERILLEVDIREEVIIHRVRVTQYRVMDVGESETAVLTAHVIVGDRICHKNDSGY